MHAACTVRCARAHPVQVGDADVGHCMANWPCSAHCTSVPHWWPSPWKPIYRLPRLHLTADIPSRQRLRMFREFTVAGSADCRQHILWPKPSVQELACGTVCRAMSPTAKLWKLSADIRNTFCLVYHFLDSDCSYFTRFMPFSFLVFPRDAMHSAVLVIVILSVCHSWTVPTWFDLTIMISSPYVSPMILVFSRQISYPHSNSVTFNFKVKIQVG